VQTKQTKLKLTLVMNYRAKSSIAQTLRPVQWRVYGFLQS